METVTKMAWNPDTGQEYEIEFPAPEEVKKAILEIDYPPHGLMNKEVAAKTARRFGLSDEQENARNKFQVKKKSKDTIWRDNIIFPNLQKLLNEEKLEQPEGSGKPYVPTVNTLPIESDLNSNLGITSEESIEDNYQKIQVKLAVDLLEKIKNNTPAFSEKLVVDLLVKMGYGGSREDAGKAVGGSSDGGIDGIIKADPLGLNVVYIQAKRWKDNVGEPPLRDFVGALDGKGVQEGIFITTSDFNRAAKEFAERSSKRVILINGNQLAQYMIDHNVGVSVEKTYEIKRVDSDYFAENTGNP